MGIATDVIHAGQAPDPTTGSITVPIYQTSTYVQEGLGKHKGYEYARTHNATRAALEENISILEKGVGACAFASGMAAIHAVMTTLLKAGDHVVVSDNTYGGTYRLFDKVLTKFGLRFSYIDTTDPGVVADAIQPNTRMMFLETPTNPVMRLCDLRALSEIARPREIQVVVDNTFMSPYLQRPIECGADIVVHSTTKYLNGHSDSVGGVAVVTSKEVHEKLAYIQNAAGAIISPFDAWLTLRGIKTLAVRMKQHDINGRAVAAYLSTHPKVTRLYYPGLPTHPQYELACRQMDGFGAMLAFEASGGIDQARKVLEGLRVFALAESLGGVESLVCHPASMTHASVPDEDRQRLGITDTLIRLSVGIEDGEDLIADLDQALALL